MLTISKYIQKPTRIGFAIILIGALFKILHWPGANLIFMIGCMSTVLLQLWVLIKTKDRSLQDYLVTLIISSFVPYYMLKVLHWPNNVMLLFVAGIALLSLAAINIFKTSKEISSDDTAGTSTLYIYLLGSILIVIGSLFKILHWPGANLMLITGLGLFAFYIIYDVLKH